MFIINRKDFKKILQWNIVKYLLKTLPRGFKKQPVYRVAAVAPTSLPIVLIFLFSSFSVASCLQEEAGGSRGFTAFKIHMWTF